MTEPSTDVEVLPPAAQKALVFWRSNPMLPSSYRAGNAVRWDDMQRAAWLLVRLGIPVVEALGDTYVIKEQVGFKADLQRAILTRPGTGYDFEVVELDDEHATVRVRTPGGWKEPITKRITDKDITVYADPKRDTGGNYRDKPARMLLARATTLAIDTYAKGVIRGWVTDAGFAYVDDDGDAGDGAATSGEVRTESPPAPELRADGSTIPEHQRRPRASDETRAQLLARVDKLLAKAEPAVRALAESVAPLHFPNQRGPNASDLLEVEALYLDRLLSDLEETGSMPAHDVTSPAPAAGDESHGPAPSPPVTPAAVPAPADDQPPASVYDETPEARGLFE